MADVISNSDVWISGVTPSSASTGQTVQVVATVEVGDVLSDHGWTGVSVVFETHTSLSLIHISEPTRPY